MSGRIRLSSSRRAMAAMLHYARHIPTVPVARRMNLAEVVMTRRSMPLSPSWTAIFIRAYGTVCAEFPPLRRAWIPWPYPHLYEHPHSVCAVAVEREWEGERGVLYGQIRKPEGSSLDAIQRYLTRLQQADVWSVARYRVALRFGRVPAVLQRLLLWHRLDWSGKRRTKNIGTFGLTNYGMLGAESLHPIGPQTTVLTLGPVGPRGDLTVKLVYDHRVLDGAYVARCLRRLEEVLHTNILAELRLSAHDVVYA